MLSRPVSTAEQNNIRQALLSLDMPSIALSFYIFTTVVFNEGDYLNLASKVLLVAVFAGEALTNKVKLSPFFIVSAVFVFYSALSISWSIAPEASMSRVLTFINQFVCYFAVICFIRWDRTKLDLCLTCFVVSAFISGVYVTAIQGVTFQDERYSGNAVSSGQLALTSALAMTICVYRYSRGKRRKLQLAAIGCLAAFLILTSGRRGFLIITIFLLLFSLSHIKGMGRKYLAIPVAIAGICFLLWACMTNEFLYSYIGVRLESFFNFALFGQAGDASTQGRVRLIDFGIQLFSGSPLCGNGISSFESAFMTQHASWDTSADNNFVEILADLGIVGFLMYYIPLAILLIRSVGKWNDISDIERYATLCLLSMCAIDFATVWLFAKVGMLYIAILCEILWSGRTKHI